MLIKIIGVFREGSFKELLTHLLEELNVHANFLGGEELLLERSLRENGDMVLCDASLLSQRDEDFWNTFRSLPDQPGLILFDEKLDSGEQARWLAKGIDAVMEKGWPPELISEGLKTLISKRETIVEERLSGSLAQVPRMKDFVSLSSSMVNMVQITERVVNSDVSILILGETGAGKERLARALHNDGLRSRGPFIALNCGGLPENLLESELFGHEKGSFTGAVRDRKGCFELAHRGTLFLDEIGEMPLHLQVKLLRVLQEKKIKRLGGEEEFDVDVRILSATNRDIEAETEAGQFRRDLYFRLSVLSLRLPSLRERKEDLPELVKNYIRNFRYRLNRPVYGITPDAMAAIESYSWPGNIRELINVIERAVLLCIGETINVEDLMLPTQHLSNQLASSPERVAEESFLPALSKEELESFSYQELKDRLMSQFEANYFTRLLKRHEGRVGKAARDAGLQERTLFDKMRKLGLKKESFR